MVKLGTRSNYPVNGHNFAVKTSDFPTDKYFNKTKFYVLSDNVLKEPYKLLTGEKRYPLAALTVPPREPLLTDTGKTQECLMQLLREKLVLLVEAHKRDLDYEEREEEMAHLAVVGTEHDDGSFTTASNRYRKFRSTQNDEIYALLADLEQPLPISIRLQSLISQIIRLDRIIAKDVKEGVDRNNEGFQCIWHMYNSTWTDVQYALQEQLPTEHAEARAAQALNFAIRRTIIEGEDVDTDENGADGEDSDERSESDKEDA